MLYYSASDPRRSSKLPANIKSYDAQRIIDFVNQRAQEATNSKAFTTLRDNYLDYFRAYNGKFKNVKDVPRWRNRLYIRLAFKIVETLRAYFDDAFYGRTPYVTLNPRRFMFKEPVKNLEALMQAMAENRAKRRKYFNVFNYTIKYGIGITRNFWNFQRGFKPIRQFVSDGMGNIRHFQSVEKPYVKVDAPDFMVIDPLKVAFDPLNYLTSEMRYACEELEVDFDWLWNTKDIYGWQNLEELEKNLRGVGTSGGTISAFGTSPFSDPDYRGTLGESERGIFDYTRKRVTLMRYEGKLDMPGNQEDPRIYEVYIGNDNYLLNVRPSEYAFDALSYNIHGIIPQEDSHIGIGAIEPILTDQKILNILCNVRLDSLHLLIAPRILAHKNSFERGITSLNEIPPGGILDVKNMSDLGRCIMPLNMPDQGFNTFHQFWSMQNQHAEETLAMNPTARGVLAQQDRSATEVVRSLEGAHARFLHMVNYFRESGYSDHCKKEADLIQQLFEGEQEVNIPGDTEQGNTFRSVLPWDIQGDFMMEFADPTKANKEMETQLWAGLLQAFAPYFQMLAPYGVTPIPFLRGILEASPVAQKLDIQKMLPEVSPEARQFLGTENSRLERAFNAGSLPGSGMPPGQPTPVPQPEGTAMGIAMGM